MADDMADDMADNTAEHVDEGAGGDSPDAAAPGTPEEPTQDVEHLKAENEELQARLAKAEAPRRHRLRNTGAAFLVALLCVSLFAATLGVWSHRNVLNTSVWEQRVGPLGESPAVQKAIAKVLTDEVTSLINAQELIANALPDRARFLSVPLAGAIDNFVAGKISAFVASPTFVKLWKESTTQAHIGAVRLLRGQATNVKVQNGKVALNLLPIIDKALAELTKSSPTILGHTVKLPELSAKDLPDSARLKLSKALGRPIDKNFGVVTVFDSKNLEAAQKAIKLFDTLVVFLVVLTILLIPAALLLSTRRRRTALQMVVGSAVVMVLVRRMALLVQSQILARVKIPTNEAAVDKTLHTFLDPLFTAAGYVLWGLAAIALVLVLTAPYPWMVKTRRWVVATAKSLFGSVSDRATSDDTAAWVAAHVSQLQIGGWVALVLGLWWIDLSWVSFLLLVVVIGLYQLAVSRLAASHTVDGDAPQPPTSGTAATPPTVDA